MTSFHKITPSFRIWNKKLIFLCVVSILTTVASVAFWKNKTKENFKKLHDIKAKLAQIPEDEKRDLEFFFHQLMYRSTFVYTLFGDKPMSFEDFFKEECVWKHYMHAFIGIGYGLDLCAYQRGWKVWKKYETLFPLKKFLFIQQEYSDSKHTPASLGHVAVILIHKNNFLSIVKKHSSDFKKILGENFDPHEFLKDINLSKYFFFEKKIRRHFALFGILLGYGRENSWYFYELSKLRYKMERDPSLREEFEIAQTRFSSFPLKRPNFDLEYPISSPMFMCLPESKETKELKKKYRKQRKEICDKYQKGDFLEITLLKLTEE